MNHKELGAYGEQVACDFLKHHGYRIVDRNPQWRLGELDIVAYQDRVLCFIEVRTRQVTDWVHPIETLTPYKKKRLKWSARMYMTEHDLWDVEARFDVLSVLMMMDDVFKVELFTAVDI
jgi:putative endonuclease